MPSYITLTRGYVATVDDADYEALNRFKWCAEPNHGTVYAARSRYSPSPNGSLRQTWYMHWQILGKPPEGHHAHHIDGDGLNNQRANLITLSYQEHAKTQGSRGGSSAFKGVSLETRKSRKSSWRAQVRSTDGNERLYSGYFKTEEEAARAYDREALKAYGPGAYQNFPDDG